MNLIPDVRSSWFTTTCAWNTGKIGQRKLSQNFGAPIPEQALNSGCRNY